MTWRVFSRTDNGWLYLKWNACQSHQIQECIPQKLEINPGEATWKSHLLLEGMGEEYSMVLSVFAWHVKTYKILRFDIPTKQTLISRQSDDNNPTKAVTKQTFDDAKNLQAGLVDWRVWEKTHWSPRLQNPLRKYTQTGASPLSSGSIAPWPLSDVVPCVLIYGK